MAYANFDFLKVHEPDLVLLGAQAERYFKEDPNTCLIKLRQFGELLAQLVAAKTALFTSPDEAQADLLRRLKFAGALPGDTGELFYKIRAFGNRATHSLAGEHNDALTNLKCARELGVWFHRTFADAKFKPGPFVPPPDPDAATKAMREELERLRQVTAEARSTAETARLATEAEARARMSAEELASKEREDRAVWEQLAGEAEQSRQAIAAELQAMQAAAAQAPKKVLQFIAQAETAATAITLDEAATRDLIDIQLRNRGWEVDTATLRYSAGTRPVTNRNLAIAEWPTKSGAADYALFVGTHCIAVVEAKRRNKNVSAAIAQAQRYARGMRFDGGAAPIGGPWPDAGEDPILVPFVFSANGRRHLKQIETQSGIWFRDARKPTNPRRALVDWPTPDGLKGMLEIDREEAEGKLAALPIQFGFPLRPYQKLAIEEVEKNLAQDRRAMLLAMATGTGKTKLAIGMLFRLLSAKRFRRVCFVVDRSALGEQAEGEFSTTRVVSAKTFADVFGLKALGDVTPDLETKVHICTIQGLVKRVLDPSAGSLPPPVDQYDLMVIDECHRGYLLDREMSDAELSFRSQEDYVSKYRRVLEYFDAVKIGLTATPALHTVDIFGEPVFTYSYREAVIDGHLIDHEPPIGITTALAQAGIVFAQGEEIELIDTRTGEVDLTHAPDEIRFEVDEFNKKVVTIPFNRVVAEELTMHIDPSLGGKTLVFAVSDAHADIRPAKRSWTSSRWRLRKRKWAIPWREHLYGAAGCERALPCPAPGPTAAARCTDLFRAKWTADIHREWIEALLRKEPHRDRAKLERTRDLMDSSIRDCLVTGYEALIPSLQLPDPDDRHVLAAAIAGRCDAIVTQNLKDFPEEALAPFGIDVQHPDEFFSNQLNLAPGAFCGAVQKVRHRLQKPPYTIEQYLDILTGNGLVATAAELRPFAELL